MLASSLNVQIYTINYHFVFTEQVILHIRRADLNVHGRLSF